MAQKTTSTATSTEKRSTARTPVRIPVKVRHDGSESEGLTRDLSSSGIFPAGLGLGPGGWTLCEASVVRVEGPSEDKGLGIAATLDRIALMPEIG